MKVLITRLLLVLEVLVHCLYGGYNLHQFSDALGLVVYGRSNSAGSTFSFCNSFAAIRQILFIFGRCMQ